MKRLKIGFNRIVRKRKLQWRAALLIVSNMIISTPVSAHPGHLMHEGVHSFLHIEHVVGFAVLSVFAFVVMAFWEK